MVSERLGPPAGEGNPATPLLVFSHEGRTQQGWAGGLSCQCVGIMRGAREPAAEKRRTGGATGVVLGVSRREGCIVLAPSLCARDKEIDVRIGSIMAWRGAGRLRRMEAHGKGTTSRERY